MRPRPRATFWPAVLAAGLLAPSVAWASLADTFRDPRFAILGLAPLAPALADTVASTYPVASASSSVTFVYNREFDVVERRTGVPGPILGERAETLGPGRLDVAVAYSYIGLDTINGDSLHDLVNAPVLDGQVLFFPVPGGIRLRDGRVTEVLPVRASLDIDLEAHVLTPSLTYGLTRDLDVNVAVPLVQTRLALRARLVAPDPRIPEFALPRGEPSIRTAIGAPADSSEGLGDVLLRAKYVVVRGAPADVALGLGLSLPTGREEDFQGTGRTRVQPTLIASRLVGQRLEPFVNLGADLDTTRVERSILRWAVGGTATVVGPLAVAAAFLGRRELEAQTDRIAQPFFFQIERNTMVDASIGLRWRFAEAGILSANALLPVERDGLRADVIPTVQMEYTF